MTAQRKNNSEILLNCATKTCLNQCCDTECNYVKNDSLPFGITLIPGSDKLTEFPSVNNNLNSLDDASNLLEYFRDKSLCPKAFPSTNVCISTCTEFSAISPINFINGDVIIGDGDLDPISQETGILQSLPVLSGDLHNIFPNLLGINGSLYIVGTRYRRISGFDKLRFVTGSIVIVNNSELISIPTFPSLLSVGGEVKITGTYSSDDTNEEECGRSTIIIANNTVLRKITGFEAVRQINDGIFISDNPCLTHVCGFIHLYRTDRIVIKSNPKLIKIVGFCYTDTINIGLFILDNGLENESDFIISAFVTLETTANLVIIGNIGLKVLKFDALKFAGKFIVRSNDQLDEISSTIQTNKILSIENNKNLHSIKLPCLYEVVKTLSISGNNALVCLDTFDELRRVGHGIIIADNKQLVELKEFNKLKYIGSKCVENLVTNIPVPCNECKCVTNIYYDWASIIRSDDCTIIDNFMVNTFDSAYDTCAYILPSDFFNLTCNQNSSCGSSSCSSSTDTDVPAVLSYSLIIFGNQRLKAIGGFCNLKHVDSNIYIIYNIILHTINAFGQLAYALDIWIRNNDFLKYIIGFSNLLSVRDLVVYDSPCLCDFNNIKSLEFAQDIAIEAKISKSVKLPKTPIPTVLGYILYYSFDNKC